METQPTLRFLTGSLNVKYLKATPLGPPIELRGKIRQVKGRKVIVDVSVSVDENVTATGEVIAIQVPENLSFETETP